MTETFIVAVDGSDGSERALQKAIDLAKLGGANLVLTHVIAWSAFSFHTPDELAERHKRREEELDRANNALLAPLEIKVKAAGVNCETLVRHGHPAEILADVAKEKGASNIFMGRKGESKIGSLLFGSVSGSLIQISPVSVTVVP